MPSTDTCKYNVRNEAWLHNLTKFIRYTSRIYGRSIKGFCTHIKTRFFLKKQK